MLFIIIFIASIVGILFVLKQKSLSWHAIVNIYFVTVICSDLLDITLNWWWNRYRLHARLLDHPDIDSELAVVISDGFIFPLMAIIFCHVYLIAKRKWIISLLAISLMAGLEAVLWGFGYLKYIHWTIWFTIPLYTVGIFIFAKYCPRFVHYNPPIPYGFFLFFVSFAVIEFPGAFLGGALMRMYLWSPGLFAHPSADDRLIAMGLAAALGMVFAMTVPRMDRILAKSFVFMGGALAVMLFSWWMHDEGHLVFNRWNWFWHSVRYLIPFLILIGYDYWEKGYREKLGVN